MNPLQRFFAPLARWQVGCLFVALLPPLLLALFALLLFSSGWTFRELDDQHILAGLTGWSVPFFVSVLIAVFQYRLGRPHREKSEDVDAEPNEPA
jgi:hypothetical protein